MTRYWIDSITQSSYIVDLQIFWQLWDWTEIVNNGLEIVRNVITTEAQFRRRASPVPN